jgi:hypothetical protein
VQLDRVRIPNLALPAKCPDRSNSISLTDRAVMLLAAFKRPLACPAMMFRFLATNIGLFQKKRFSSSSCAERGVSGGTTDKLGKLPVRETLAAGSSVALDQERKGEIAAKVQYR